jgi:ketosteroid isomerase-like protein
MEPSTSPVETATRAMAALSEGNLELLRTLDHPEVVRDFVAIGEFRGVDACQAFFAELLAAFPDLDITVLHTVGDIDQAVVQWRVTGTFTGRPFQGVRATGSPVELRGCDVIRTEAGRLRHVTVYYDGLAFARQIGLLPKEGSAADKAMTAAFNARTDVRDRIRSRARSRAH